MMELLRLIPANEDCDFVLIISLDCFAIKRRKKLCKKAITSPVTGGGNLNQAKRKDHNMKLYKVPDYNSACRKATGLIAAQIQFKPNSVIAWPTGSTPIGVYEKLAALYERGELDFSEITSFNLDEYCGIADTDPQSYHYFMNEQLFSKVNTNKDRQFFPDQNAADIEQACKDYEEKIASCGGLDFVFLGIGTNGHIGFNEPAPVFSTSTHCVALDEKTIADNARFFERLEDVPREALTMGIKTIMLAKKIILVASGPAKREIMQKALYGPITPEVPGSILQVHHDVTVIWSEN